VSDLRLKLVGMLVLHGVGTGRGELLLWAEDSALPARAADRTTDVHPFAVPAAELAERTGLDRAGAAELTVVLPSYPAGPAHSPELVRDPLTAGPALRGRIRLRAWRVPAVRISGAVPDLTELPEVRLGPAAHYLLRLARAADDLVAAGRVLPSLRLHAQPDRATAHWRAALSGADATRFGALAAAMPAAFRAERADLGAVSGQPPADLLRAVLDARVDAGVRARTGPVPGGHPWLTALTGAPEFTGEPARLRALAEQIANWQTAGHPERPVRTCFRLRTPLQAEHRETDPGAEPVWRLEFLMQPVAEPSVLVPAAAVWRDDARVLERWLDEPQDQLLADLGRAGRILADVDLALRARRPEHLDLDAGGAYRFLTAAAELDQAGFGVLLPSWWRQPAELGLSLVAGSPGTTGVVARDDGLGLKTLVDYRWELSLGEARLTPEELAELAAAKVPLVRVRGQWVHLDAKRLAAGLKFLATATPADRPGQMSAGEVLLHAGLTEPEHLPLPVTGVSAGGWLGDLLSGRVDRQLEPVEPPPSFHGTLRPYQRRGLAWLVFLDRLGLGACLADDMGLGKTVQLLALETVTRAAGRRPPTLLICPMSVVGNWQREAAVFAPDLSVHVHHGAQRRSGAGFAAAVAGHDLVLTTYAVASKDVALLAEVGWDRVVLDEAQNIKNAAARQSRAVRALPARHRVALTGTPVENRLAELWSVLDFANPGALGPAATFRARYSVPVERHGDEEAAARLRRVTGPFVLRRLKTDPAIIDDLPEKVEMTQLCNLTAEQASLYRAVVDDMLAKIGGSDGIQRKGLVLATMSKLKQVCNHPAQFLGDGSRVAGRSGKLARFEEIVAGALADGDKVLAFTQFARFGGMLVPYLSARFDTEVQFLHGGTSKTARERMVRRFQADGGPKVFLLSLKAGGTGLNLTAANHVVHLDRWWNPAVEDQATDRAFRIGQRRTVQVRKLACAGTLEERIDTLLAEKKALAQLAVGAGEQWLTELSTASLRDLLTLSGEAVGD
jgi:hypothetical protein